MASLDLLAGPVRALLEAHWDDERGSCVPNPTICPHLWLWDSCFHAIVWAHLGDARAVTELEAVAGRLPGGLVPHMRHGAQPPDTWLGPLERTSSLRSPPMFGHAARVLAERDLRPGDELLARARRGWRRPVGADPAQRRCDGRTRHLRRRPAHAALDQLTDPDRFGSPAGPANVARSHPAYDPGAYWRGAAWPHLAYLLHLALLRWGRHDEATVLARRTRRTAQASRWAECWNAETGEGLGAVPQSWTGLVLAMDRG